MGYYKNRRRKTDVGKIVMWLLVVFLVVSIFPVLFSLGSLPSGDLTDPTVPPTEPPYDVLMEEYALVASDNFTNPDETLCNLNYGGTYITRQTDEDGNGYLLFSDYPSGTGSTYVQLKHGLGSVDQIVFEFEFCWEDPGLYLAFYSRGEHKQILGIANGALYFHSPEGSVSVGCEAGTWYKVTYALDLTTGTYNGYVNEEQFVYDAPVPAGMTQLTSVRLQIDPSSNNNGSDGNFMLDDLKWYVPADIVEEEPAPSDPTEAVEG